MKHLYRSVFSASLFAALTAAPSLSGAQPVQPPSQAEAQAALNPAPAPLSNAQLDQLLAPIALAIPCHRVVRSDGELAGYRWGIERKRGLLENEAVA